METHPVSQRMPAKRRVTSLPGPWSVSPGGESPPGERFAVCPVPGLIDMATPPVHWAEFPRVWYSTTFPTLPQPFATATLLLRQALYGYVVWCNGIVVGQWLGGFVPREFDLTGTLKSEGESNLLEVGVLASRERAEAGGWPTGFDPEKLAYLPGICDEVEIAWCGQPRINRVQVSPQIEFRGEESILVRVDLSGLRGGEAVDLSWRVTAPGLDEAASVGVHRCQPGHGSVVAFFEAPVPDARLWSPDTPELYHLELETEGDRLSTRFGMRAFRFHPVTKRAELNGEEIFLGGTNVCLHRFYEDPLRAGLPWDRDWVRCLLRKFKGMNWNCFRFSIGFAPEFWYDLCDEEGLLIQDEAPIWGLRGKETVETLAAFYSAWIVARANHPSVVIWDAQNETNTSLTRRAVQAVRGIDLSDRPWDLGWDRPPLRTGDIFESHPYFFYRPSFELDHLALADPTPVDARLIKEGRGHNATDSPIVINEYSWLWLRRDGTATRLSRDSEVYRRLGLADDSPPAERRRVYAETVALLTEFWRAGGKIAGLMHFCSLTACLPKGFTSDEWLDPGTLAMEPAFETLVRDAFAPCMVIPLLWNTKVIARERFRLPLLAINDGRAEVQASSQVSILQKGTPVASTSTTLRVPAHCRSRFEVVLPRLPLGTCRLETSTEICGNHHTSIRNITGVPPADWMFTV